MFDFHYLWHKRSLWNIILGIILISVLLLPGCQIFNKIGDKAKVLIKCKFELVKVDKKVSFAEKTSNIWNYVIQIDIAGTNPNSENITLGGYKLALYANNKWISDIATQVPISLKANATTIITLKTIISPSGVLGVFWKKLIKKKIEYKIKGTFFLRLENISVPIEVQLFKIVDNPN
ncbi:MAG: LEA type 2 family protein [Bacteroidia bacterium]|nr:LEA type 2 family protein [Bacteroidia bacterium]